MLVLDVSSNIPQVLSAVKEYRRQLPFATALALTRTAQDVKAELTDQIPRLLDRPIPYTAKSVYMRPATKARLVAEVGLINEALKGTPPTKYLRALIRGGNRSMKRFERAMQRAGYLGSSEFLMPGQAAPIDAYGNVPGPFIVKMLSALRSFTAAGYNMNRARGKKVGTVKQREFFFSRGDKHLPRGVWERFPAVGVGVERQDGYVKPILIAAPRAFYSKRFDFYGIATDTAAKRFGPQFAEAFERAMATAR